MSNASSPWLALFRRERAREKRRKPAARVFVLNEVEYVVKQMPEAGCKGCAFEHNNTDAVRLTACAICMHRVNTIYVEKTS